MPLKDYFSLPVKTGSGDPETYQVYQTLLNQLYLYTTWYKSSKSPHTIPIYSQVTKGFTIRFSSGDKKKKPARGAGFSYYANL